MSYRSVFSPDLFTERTIIVTGGGSGIGRCTAHELTSLGAHCVLFGRDRAKLVRTVAEIVDVAGRADFATCDIRDEDGVRQTIGQIVLKHGSIGGLVNNAGGQFPAALAQTSGKGFDTVVRNNLTGGFLMAREVYTQSMASHGGQLSISLPIFGAACQIWAIVVPRALECLT